MKYIVRTVHWIERKTAGQANCCFVGIGCGMLVFFPIAAVVGGGATAIALALT